MINLDDRILSKVTPNELFLLLQIVKRMRINKMISWPSIELLAKECDWDERTVKTWRSKLIQKGYISIEIRSGKPTLYRLTGTGISVYHAVDSDQGIQEELKGGTKNEGVQSLHKKGVQKMRGKGVQKMTPELVNKELVNNGKGVNPAPDESETLKAEKKENAPPVAPPPPAEAATPFTMPKRVETVDEAEEIIMEWAKAEGRESVRKWYADAARQCTAVDVTAMVAKFAGVYLTIGDEGKRQRMAQDPLQFFKYTFKSFLKTEKSFSAKVMPGPTQQTPPANYQSSTRY